DHLPVTRVLHAEHCTVVHCDKEYFAENISITENIDELWECYETFSQNYSGMVFRGSYFTVKMLDYISNNLKCAVLRENGKIKAYVIYGENNGGAVCEECIGFSSYLLCALDFICKNVGNFSADLPPDTNLDMISGNTKILSGALAGICNVSVLLAALKSNCPLTVNVTDKIIDGNNGTYSFNGMKTEKPADIFMSAGGLVQLLFGYLAPSELLCSRKNNDILEKYFSAKNCFTADLY
ncbi:MAG: sterol carrier protein domain-containing protein, partial [Bacillota bacterium]|nr:sterol carrier protein domain-containing protein [Bacillota bacterium]